MSPQRAEQRLAALIEAGMSLAAELDLDVLLQRIADVAREVIGCRYSAVGVLGEGGLLARFVYSGIDQATADRIGPLPQGRGVLGVIIEEGRPLRLRDVADHARSIGFPPHHPPMTSFLGVPILSGRRIFGRLYLTEKEEAKAFSKDDERIAQMLASQAGIAVEKARLSEALQDLAVLEERDRIAKELHDGVIQSIYSVGLSLQSSIALMGRDPDAASTRIDAAIAELDNVVRDVRSYIFELRPKLMAEKGFVAAIEELAKDFEVNTLAATTLELSEGACSHIPGADQAHLIQIVREVLSNIARHARASNLWLRFSEVGDELRLTIEDDGTPYDPHGVRRGQGLDNIESRVETLGATLDIARRPDRGMRHEVCVPRRTGEKDDG